MNAFDLTVRASALLTAPALADAQHSALTAGLVGLLGTAPWAAACGRHSGAQPLQAVHPRRLLGAHGEGLSRKLETFKPGLRSALAPTAGLTQCSHGQNATSPPGRRTRRTTSPPPGALPRRRPRRWGFLRSGQVRGWWVLPGAPSLAGMRHRGPAPEPPSAGAQWPARMAWLRKAAPSKAAPLFLGCKVLTSHPHSDDSEVLLAESPGAPQPSCGRLAAPHPSASSPPPPLPQTWVPRGRPAHGPLGAGFWGPRAKARTGAATVHVTPSSDLCSWGRGLNRYEHCSCRLLSSGCTVTNQQGQEQNQG